MIAMRLSDAATATKGGLIGDDGRFVGVATDSRQIAGKELFVAIPGERVDGHEFVAQAAATGAAGALVNRPLDGVSVPQLVVDDSIAALGQLGSVWRQQQTVRVIGLTGSNGKTTTKTMLHAILSRQHQTLATAGNFNNEIGLPLTLCQLGSADEFAVIEMGAAKPGDIRYLADLTKPDIGLITNAAPAHLQGMGTVDDVAATKGELFTSLSESATVVINADDDYADFWSNLAGPRKQVTFGLSSPADVSGRYQPGRLTLVTPFGDCDIALSTTGVHNAMNALAAATVALALEIPLADVKAGLEAFEPVAGRLEREAMAAGWTMIADTYNANPGSLRAGLEAALEIEGEHWLVLGDMGELGEQAEALHFQAGAEARRLGVTRLFAYGDLSRHAASAFGDGGSFFSDRDRLVDALRGAIRRGVVLMIKGSRSMRMETVAAALKEPV